MVRLVALVVTAGVPLMSIGCGADRGTYVKANERLFATLPSFPGANLQSETSTAYRLGDDVGSVLGYGTRFDLKLPGSATRSVVSSFFRRQLQPQWRLVETLHGAVFNFRRRKAFVSVNLDNTNIHAINGLPGNQNSFEIAVDYAYYGKLGR